VALALRGASEDEPESYRAARALLGMTTVSCAVEGALDEVIARRLLAHVGLVCGSKVTDGQRRFGIAQASDSGWGTSASGKRSFDRAA
jgi:hypothetical protein